METINLVKAHAEAMTVNLQKRGIVNIPPMRVVADLDVSGSMNGLYQGGTVENAFKRLLGLAMKFDDNGEIDTFAFDSECHPLPTAKLSDYGSYVTQNITNHFRQRYGGGTRYSGALSANMDFLFPEPAPAKASGGLFGMFAKKPTTPAPATAEVPALVLFFTDGDNDSRDNTRAREIIHAAEQDDRPVYFHLVGMGTDAHFSTLKEWADAYDNCGFVNLRSLEISDDDLYKALTTDEFIAFLRKHGAS